MSSQESLRKRALILEPFLGGSHAKLCHLLEELEGVEVVGLPSKSKWHWRMLTSAWKFADEVPNVEGELDCLLVSAMTNLAELLGLRSDLQKAKRKILYFHENQLEYPRQNFSAATSPGQSDFNLCWNQIVGCLVVDTIVFNSRFNMESFFEKVGPFVNRLPSASRPPMIPVEKLRDKSIVLGIPISLSLRVKDRREPGSLHIVWPHRWEHDKGQDRFLVILEHLNNAKEQVQLSVLGETHASAQEDFAKAREQVRAMENILIRNWGEKESFEDYVEVLDSADVAVSTSSHEFFGIAMMEAAFRGCLPLCPNALCYPELYPKSCLYNSEQQLLKVLIGFAKKPEMPMKKMSERSWGELLRKFQWRDAKGSSGESMKTWSSLLLGT